MNAATATLRVLQTVAAAFIVAVLFNCNVARSLQTVFVYNLLSSTATTATLRVLETKEDCTQMLAFGLSSVCKLKRPILISHSYSQPLAEGLYMKVFDLNGC